ncbi:GNAT family N-acetyltransferase [Azospirillum sp. TSO35-2]|uniref:GNAT family N-acetyltransferase n=1 Tax=Azospirillum sp. TSO35-2 TaxID=716796 RepID=UPI0018EEABEE|nr:GNAT family N-acetyltransferase [Azospirillum sp. TSO35-2]
MTGFAGSFTFPGNLTVRFTTPSDEPFLLTLFIEARPWLAWADGNADFLRTLYEQQYRTMRAGQEAIYPEHIDLLIEKAGDRVGRLVVDLGTADWRVSELQVLTKARGTGIGSDILRGLQMAAGSTMMPITLSTPLFGSHGRQVYERLGFRVMNFDPPHFHMAWLPAGHPDAALATQIADHAAVQMAAAFRFLATLPPAQPRA